jgi:trimeric autotransporter adhesin
MRTPRLSRLLLLLPLVFAASVSDSFAQRTRIEQDNPAIVYGGNWYSNGAAANSGGSAALTNTRGSTVTLSFTGTGISWIGVLDGWAGLATVTLDGASTILDTFANVTKYQSVVFSAQNLASGAHTLTIEITHERGPNTSGSWVWIDAFDIENGAPIPGGLAAGDGRVEQNDPALVYSGHWFSNNNAAHSAGSATLATDTGARVTLRFNGVGIKWNAFRDENSGVARVFLDGVLKATIDTYLSPPDHRVVFAADGLSSVTHTLVIEVTGTHNESAKGSWVWVDSFDVTEFQMAVLPIRGTRGR